ncbi:PREDICTED: E3 ubiquitin protein ligase DRIP1-like [Tarenaya hassleriana]|uniref:E3 ubiquitin protein ligase DRIP1-like n=1 Tax=Tarenaya hassleriana TaxID=28532 RepID=UPI00053C7F84|nr:PREDICTED: E3 ubiquitin protein ligase DRIP1-like [Tarenaya hassleriana]
MHHVELRRSIKFRFFPFFGCFFGGVFDQRKMVMKVKLEKEKLKTCLTCPICNDLFDRATTISECLHTFCRKCIYDKITEEDLDSCPVCNADLGCAPLEKLRPDHSLQDLRLKLFPENGENSKVETETSEDPLSNSRRKEKSLSSLVAGSDADTTKVSNLDHETVRVHSVSDSVIVGNHGEKVEDVLQVKISPRGLPKHWAGRRKSKPSPEKNDVRLESDMLNEEEPRNKAGNAPKIQSVSMILPDNGQDHRLNYEAVPFEGEMPKKNTIQENEEFPFNLWKPLSCLAEAADKTKFGKSNEPESKPSLDRKPVRDDASDQMTVEPIVPSNSQEDGKSAPSSENDKAKTSVPKQKGRSNGNCSSPPSLRPRKLRKILGIVQKNESVPEVIVTSQEATAVEANDKAEGRNVPVWFSLVASENQGTKAPLPQISSCYLRVKDANLPVSYIQKYLVKKLSLASEAEVEISLRGEPLHSSLRLHSLRDWWVQKAPVSERLSPLVGGSAKDFVMVLSYSRKSLL